ncbi:MAG: ribosome small subunit-dependent GTPase A [Spirochaetae bacterium HGW-Spirochaetae-1]|jgi:ribosome biogenesis GTPase|nr:MAG: ribosome small subunit-dependent GTPase A [Spirochaetae bacterium HGW-Spirochaetae-1]
MEGKVIKGFGRYYTVKSGSEEYTCVLRGKIKQDKRLKRYSDPVAVGDLVAFFLNADGGGGVIETIHERKNIFSRKDRGNRKEDILASNLDQIIVIQSYDEPPFNLRFVDRLFVRGEKEGIPVLLCVNKSDLAGPKDEEYIRSYYKKTNMKVISVSARTGRGLGEMKKMTAGKCSVLAGYSGVGKSSILNGIYPGLDLKTSTVSESTGKGRHTTTNVALVDIDDRTSIIDSPGLREFGLMDIEPRDLAGYFSDFRDYIDDCRFKPCTHDHEPECGVKKQVEAGGIFYDRYISYLNILYSLKEYYDNMYS